MTSFDTGLFLTLMILGFLCIFASVRFGSVFRILGAFSFFILGIVLLAGYDVSALESTTDGTTTLNKTSYFIGNGTDTHTTGNWLGWIFILLGIFLSLWFFLEMING